jgi:hypothetical protein
MASKALDNSNPVVHATGLPGVHKGQPASQRAQLANLWRTSLDDVQTQDNQLRWMDDSADPARSISVEKEDIDEQEVFGKLRWVE